MRFKWANILVLSFLALTVACPAANTSAQSLPFPTVFSDGVVTDGLLNKRVFWYDKGTLIFDGSEAADTVLHPLNRRPHIYVWKPPAKPQIYANNAWPGANTDSLAAYLCAGDSRISYAVKPADIVPSTKTRPGSVTWTLESGPLDHETRFIWRQEAYNKYAGPEAICGDKGPSPTDSNHMWAPSFDRRYAVDWKVTTGVRWLGLKERGQLNLIDRRNGRRSVLEIPVDDFAYCVFPTPWETSFVLWDCMTTSTIPYLHGGPAFSYPQRHPSGIPVWRVNASGKLNKTIIRNSVIKSPNWEKTVDDIFYTRQGYFMTILAPKDAAGNIYPETGLYRIVDDKPQQVLRGYLRLAAVSPDGCHVAFHDWRNQSPIRASINRISIMDVCSPNRPKA